VSKTIEAIVDKNGVVHLKEKVKFSKNHRALVTILEEESESPDEIACQAALMSERALAKDWNRPEEEEAWSHLQQDQSF
jgi:hypothetical protein